LAFPIVTLLVDVVFSLLRIETVEFVRLNLSSSILSLDFISEQVDG